MLIGSIEGVDGGSWYCIGGQTRVSLRLFSLGVYASIAAVYDYHRQITPRGIAASLPWPPCTCPSACHVDFRTAKSRTRDPGSRRKALINWCRSTHISSYIKYWNILRKMGNFQSLGNTAPGQPSGIPSHRDLCRKQSPAVVRDSAFTRATYATR